jgi:hypothetical protein
MGSTKAAWKALMSAAEKAESLVLLMAGTLAAEKAESWVASLALLSVAKSADKKGIRWVELSADKKGWLLAEMLVVLMAVL